MADDKRHAGCVRSGLKGLAMRIAAIPPYFHLCCAAPARWSAAVVLFYLACQWQVAAHVPYKALFPGGYPAMTGKHDSAKMYMEGYFLPPVTASPSYPAWSPDATTIAFSYQGRIWEIPADGGVARQVTRGRGYHSQPSWSPDGRFIAYASDVDLNFDIYVLDRLTGVSQRVTDHPHLDVRPKWSPDGGGILYTTSRDGTFDLWIYDVRERVSRPLITDSGQHDMDGDWVGKSGDVIFVSKRGETPMGSGSIWRWNSTSHSAQLLQTIESNYQVAPTVAYHGGIVAYVSDAAGNNDILVIPSRRSENGIQPIRITETRHDEFFPAWSPDGERLIYARNGGQDGTAPGFALYTLGKGGGRPQPLIIERYEWTDPVGSLAVRIQGSDGRPLPARVYLRASDGQSYFPDNSYPRVVSGEEDYYFHSSGSFELTVPAGTVEIEVWRGFEYEPEQKTVSVAAGGRVSVDIELVRWIDMAARGWYSGDNHIHANYGGHYFIAPADLRGESRAEDLNVANGMIANLWGNSRVEDEEHFLGRPHPGADARTVVYYNEEYRPNFFAHLSLLNLKELATPFYIGYPATAFHSLYPDNATILRRVHQQGAIGGYVHPMGISHDEPYGAAEVGYARELPVDTALGLADFVDVACVWSDELESAGLWYRLLNTGSRIPATAGSDVMTDMWRNPAVGTTRSYVFTGKPELQYDDWVRGLVGGRAFVTNGPIMELDVSGAGMGDELTVAVGSRLRVTAVARSVFRMDRLEIVQNGEVVHSVEATGNGREIRATFEIPAFASHWISARALGPAQHGAMDSYVFAHTNPVFVLVNGRPIRSGKDAAFFAKWIEQVIDELRAMDAWDDPAHKNEVLSTFEQGRQHYRRLVTPDPTAVESVPHMSPAGSRR